MEKTYKILKVVLLVLCFAAILLGAKRLYDVLGSRVEMESLATQPTEAAQPEKQAAPDFTAYDGDGNAIKLSDFRGKPVILNFWASWCGPCKMEMPDFEEKYQEYGEKIQFLMLNQTDGSRETVDSASSFIAEQGYTFPVYFDSDWSGAAAYGVNAVPVTYFIDAEGNFVAWKQGTLSVETLQQGIDMLLAE
ncbi:MAG: redoxin domain-containing protein [Faecousia sp.]